MRRLYFVLALYPVLPGCLTAKMWDDLTSGTTVEAVARQVTVELAAEEALIRRGDLGPTLSIGYGMGPDPLPQVLRDYSKGDGGWINLHGEADTVGELLSDPVPLEADSLSLFITHDPETTTERIWRADLRISGVVPTERFGHVVTPVELKELQLSGDLAMPIQVPSLLQQCMTRTETYQWPTLLGLGYESFVVHAVAWLGEGGILETTTALDSDSIRVVEADSRASEIVQALADYSLLVRAVPRRNGAEAFYLVLNADTLWLSDSIALDRSEDGIFWTHYSSWSVTATPDRPRTDMSPPARLPAMEVTFSSREVFVTKNSAAGSYVVAGLLTPITLIVDAASFLFVVWQSDQGDDSE